MNARCLYFHCHSLLPLRHVLLSRSVSGAVVKTCTHFLASNQEMLYLKRGLNEEEDIFYLTDLKKSTINQKFTDRLQFHGQVPNVDILLKNLTLDDTGPYWCVYKMTSNYELKASRGNGSVLLVVTGEAESFPLDIYVIQKPCKSSTCALQQNPPKYCRGRCRTNHSCDQSISDCLYLLLFILEAESVSFLNRLVLQKWNVSAFVWL
uniref:Immunoglobulin V-set domain-containing protein n=1 Tax=Maylandia zebra TaxID=106582 RepID=A0A3P9C573_9CICH